MLGAIIIAVVVIVVIPVGFLMSTALVPALLGVLLKNNAEAEHEGSELIDCNY